MLIGKMFDSPDGRKVQVIEDDGMFVTISGGAKVRRDNFLTTFSETITTDNFFNKPVANLSNLANQLSNIDTSKISDADTAIRVRKLDDPSGNVITQNTVERKDLYENFAQRQQMINPNDYRQIDDDDVAAESLMKSRPQPRNQQPPQIIMDDDTSRLVPQQRTQSPPQQQYQETYIQPSSYEPNPEEEAYKFFKGFKKNFDAKIKLDFVEKIAKPDFLRMMADNYEADIVRYYTKEIINNIYGNPQKLEDMVYKELKKIILGEDDFEDDDSQFEDDVEVEMESKPKVKETKSKKKSEPKNIPPPPEPPQAMIIVEGKEPPKPKILKKIVK